MFQEEMQRGDYIVIPDQKRKRITIGRAGGLVSDECGTWRRSLDVLSSLSLEAAGTRIEFAIYGKEGIISLDQYAEDILSCLFTVFEYKNSINVVSNISCLTGINSIEYLKLTKSIADILSYAFDEDEITIVCNFNSPGRQRLKAKSKSKETSHNKSKKQNVNAIALVLVLAFGGKYGDFEFGGIPAAINATKSIVEIRQENDMHPLRVESAELENLQKNIDLLVELKSSGIDLDELEQQLLVLNSAQNRLKVLNSEEYSAEIDNQIANSIVENVSESED